MAEYATGGYIPSLLQSDDRIPAFLSPGGCYLPMAVTQPVHLDDDECVVHHTPDGWVCARVLHQCQPCQSPATPTPQTQPEAEHAGTGGQGEGSEPSPTRTTSAAQPTPHARPLPSTPHPSTHTQGQAEAGQGTGKAAHPDASPTRTT